jgi:hypothetical protein
MGCDYYKLFVLAISKTGLKQSLSWFAIAFMSGSRYLIIAQLAFGSNVLALLYELRVMP